MARMSKLQFHWKTAYSIFFGSCLTGFVILSLIGYLNFQQGLFEKTQLLTIYLFPLLLILLFSLALTLWVLRRLSQPLIQIEQISLALPLLSAKKYQQARQLLSETTVSSIDQEVIELSNLTHQLINVLDHLDQHRRLRNQQVQIKNRELRKDRDFIKSLLDTAQLIVLTIDKKFDISLFNDYGEQITGYNKNEVINTNVARMFPASHWTEANIHFNELLAGHQRIAQQDAELIDKTGLIRQISWLHSRLEHDNQQAVILSVGLDMTDKKEAEKRIVWMAEHDPLTDLCNRRKFIEEFEKSLRMAIRYHHHNTLLYLDLDQFKDINDTSGHRAGDELLILVARALKRITRFTDLVARLGGDEFAILMPESDPEGAITLAKKVIHELSTIQLEYGAVHHKVSTSIGIVHFPLQDASIHELMGFADLAMYQAKAFSKGSFHTFSPDDRTREQLQARVLWKHRIEQALEQDLFVLFYQPILELQTDKIEHYEVLLRMRDPGTGELRLPGKFIQIAEQVGLIQQIDHYVIYHALQQLGALQKQGRNVCFAINLSGLVIDTSVLLPLLEKTIAEHQVNPNGIIFEITETVAVSNLQQAKAMMQAIKALGCRFSLDDFGVGFSSFNYMRELPVDIIKIDGIFIKNLDKNADDQLFVKALVDVAKGLNRQTTAEFVENAEILALLRGYGVDFAQGYHIGRPQPALLDSTTWSETVSK
ncbi:MAG TPA: GGDEF domain-containing protein [Methylophaga sp.]|uniref:putative bifunctional diguanylate cyclase/phosphodiesterase n=1 Tax=unclassified Methylophaga TaxID=2629249 RepID=UPI000C8A14D6|nr:MULTISPECIES: EAL domain-containing protein [unclassified Methylophaga]MAP26660.1 GGDEF domain-containing protein [Methylophaga sp.]HAD31060.1 GGDEF domain-containing protein [Methylophaga sp.]